MPRWTAKADADGWPERPAPACAPSARSRRGRLAAGSRPGRGWRGLRAPGLAGPALALLLMPAGAAVPSACPVAAGADMVRMREARVAGSAEIVPDDGPVLRLAGLLVLPEDADAARAAMVAFAGTQTLVASGAATRDRHGRRAVRIRRADDGAGLAETLLESGLALLTGTEDADGCLAALRPIEARARAARRGLWGRGHAGPFDATDPQLAARAGQFVLVEGRILSTGQTSRMRFLNFGSRWTLDFTVTISESDRQDFVAAGLDPATLAGTRVRVRGWLLSRDGGAMRLAHPGQIERLGMGE